ncbi:MAG: hypothetical protein DBY44_00350 [Veillonellaceae bacterium]|nr:MAG: hypothetical protein DBY44_06250 [Veillonellaceae bacterium]PWL47781.1 MAG: hypothetical protein DBY44_00350 [Veillonellaceae bacterium]
MKGKHRLLSFTVGCGEDHYRKDGQNRYPVEEFLYSFEHLAALCQGSPLSSSAVRKNFWMYCITFAVKETLNNLLIPVA